MRASRTETVPTSEEGLSKFTTVEIPRKSSRPVLSRRAPFAAILCSLLLYLILFVGKARCTNEVDSAKLADLVANVSDLLNTLLGEEHYDRQIRPGYGGKPTTILTDIEIRSFGPLSENDMVYSMDCYFRQTWFDERLKFNRGGMDELSMDWKFLQKVWIPDTYFFNGKHSHLHKVTVPNKFIRVRNDGQLKYSMRVTIKAQCPMHLRKYPLDTQACPLEIGSFGYNDKDILYRWKGPKPIVLSDDVTLSQYAIISITTVNRTKAIPNREEKKSAIVVGFILQRRRGYYILQIYAPCAMIVGASWVAFWINRNDAAGRVTVGATTVLTLVTMGFTGRASLPRANYPTALDWFVIMCFTFVFTALVEYACVNFVDKFEKHRRQKRKDAILKSRADQEKAERLQAELLDQLSDSNVNPDGELILQEVDLTQADTPLQPQFQFQQVQLQQGESSPVCSLAVEEVIEFEREETRPVPSSCTQGIRRRFRRKRPKSQRLRDTLLLQELEVEEEDPAVASLFLIAAKIDITSRVVFPITFAVLNLIYWTMYLYIIDDELPNFATNEVIVET